MYRVVLLNRSCPRNACTCRRLAPPARSAVAAAWRHELRFAASPILDLDAAVDRIVYTVCNLASASLIEHFRQWPGLCGSFADFLPRTFERADQRAYQVSLCKAELTGATVDQNAFIRVRTLKMIPLMGIEPQNIVAAIEQRQQALKAVRRGPVFGVKALLVVDPFDTPLKSSSNRRNPICHTSIPTFITEFRQGWRAFIDAYAQASARFRAGEFATQFPDWTFRPFCPLIE